MPPGGQAYVDPAVFAVERERLLARVWTCVGREDEVALPGQWLREEVAGEPVLVVRGPDLALRAFFDVCRHRGASLSAGAPCGRARRLECPYHGWTYELDGRLVEAPFVPAGFDRAAHGLRAVRVEAWRGFVFVTLDAAAAPLAVHLDGAPPWLDARTLSSLRRGSRQEHEARANWKLLAQNFQESHHFPRVHRALERLTPTATAETWGPNGPWLGGTMRIEDAETVSQSGERRGRPLLVSQDRTGMVFDALLFPTLLTSLQPDYFLTYRLVPLAADRTRIVSDVYFHPAAFTPTFDPADVLAFWERVNAEDRAICEDQQRNASSRAFDPACYATVEEGVQAFDALVGRALEGSAS